MSETTKDFIPPAFPVPNNAEFYGMDLRDWFAGMAMKGFIAADSKLGLTAETIAEMAYDQADEMIAERAK